MSKLDREAQKWIREDWEDRIAHEARNDTVIICCALACVVLGWFLLNGVADWSVGL
jgi:hypothetical protein